MGAGIRSRPWAGLGVGSFSVKLLATQGGVGGSRTSLAEAPYPAGSSDREHPPAADVVAKTIGECLSPAGLPPRSFRGISIGIGRPGGIARPVPPPLLGGPERWPAPRLEARQHPPFDPHGLGI